MSEEKHYLSNGSDAAKQKPGDALEFARRAGAKMVDLKFTDLLGTWQHASLPLSAIDEDAFQEGLGFDGSSIRGWKGISESDMLLMPDAATAMLDPFTEVTTLSLLCGILDPLTREPYERDPRLIAKRSEAYLVETGIADTAYFGPEAEFFVFDDVSFEVTPNRAYYEVDSSEGYWNSGNPGGGYTIREKHGYFPVSPHDTLQDLRTEMVLTLERLGVACEYHHHEVATAGQCEIDMRFSTLTRMADQLMTYKYVVRNAAKRAGKTATFMPKPIFGDNGSGMHCHQSLWKDGKTLMADDSGYAGLSDLARGYVGGLLKHAPALLAFTAPTTNSYRRLVPGYEAPVNLVYSQRNRSACIRIPVYSASPKAKRIEFRCPDPLANPYLAFPAMLLAGLDGIQKGMDPGEPADYDLFEEVGADIPQVPGSLAEALDALEADHEFLLAGGVFTEGLIRTWIDWKRENEVDPVRLRPHPLEFSLYYDA
jgi:glutamine synthetase